MVEGDLAQVIYDPEEFGVRLVWNGVEVTGRVERQDGEAAGVDGRGLDPPAVNQRELLVELPAAAVPRPKVGQEVDLDGELWLVSSTRVAWPVLRVLLARNLA